MAVQFQEEDAQAQHSLRVGDTVLLYAKEANGFVFSELTRYIDMQNVVLLCICQCSQQHNSVALFKTNFFRDPNFSNVNRKFTAWLCDILAKSLDAELHWLPPASIVLCWSAMTRSSFSLVVATFKVVTANKYKAQERLDTFIKSKKWGCVKRDRVWSLV